MPKSTTRRPTFAGLILCAAITGLTTTSCRKVSDAIKGTNTIGFPEHGPSGWTVSKLNLIPHSMDYEGKKASSHTLALTVSGAAPKANERLAMRAACIRRGRVWASGWLHRSVTMDKADRFPFSFLIAPGDKVETCEIDLAHFEKATRGSGGKLSAIGTACFHEGALRLGACDPKELPRPAAPGPDIAELSLKTEPNVGEAAPGKTLSKYRLRGRYLLGRGTKAPGRDGISLHAQCETPSGTEERFMGYPSQSKQLKPGEWLDLPTLSWTFDVLPTRCELNWAFGKGSLMPSEDPPRQEPFAYRCWDGKTVSKGRCSPDIAAPSPSTSAAPSPSTSAAPSPSASAD